VDLVVCDLDGTLTATNQVDSECFAQAIADAAGILDLDRNWSRYECVTDPGITTQILAEHFGKAPDAAQLAAVHDQFVELLKDRLVSSPESFGELPGATESLYRLRNEHGWAIAIASGTWRAAGRIKLQSAGISPEGFPSVFADDSISREGIIELAITRALERYKQPDFGRIVVMGDGVWDVRAAWKLGLPFVGVAAESNGDRLRAHGASHVIHDFIDFDGLMKCLSEAKIPGVPAEHE